MCAIMGSTKKLDKSEIPAYFDRTVSRGPDMSRSWTPAPAGCASTGWPSWA